MKIDWKRKLTSRKFWAAVSGFVSMLLIALGKDAGTAQTVTGMIMASASLIAYIIGEGLADSGDHAPAQTDGATEFTYSIGFSDEEGTE